MHNRIKLHLNLILSLNFAKILVEFNYDILVHSALTALCFLLFTVVKTSFVSFHLLLSHTSLTPKMRWKPQMFSPCNFPCLSWTQSTSRWGCSSLSTCVQVFACCKINMWFFYLLGSFLYEPYTVCHWAMWQPLFTETGEIEMKLNVAADHSSSPSPRHTLPPLCALIPLQLVRGTWLAIPVIPSPLNPPTHTQNTPQPDILVLSQLASGCRAKEHKHEAPPLGQLLQTPSLPWASHSLIQGSFVVLTSWNSWAAQPLMLL